MNIVEREAVEFIETFYGGLELGNPENLKSKLTKKLCLFNRDRDKLDFLKVIRRETIVKAEEHSVLCKDQYCDTIRTLNNGIFVIDQEIDSVNWHYDFEVPDKDKFAPQEESDIHSKLNSIIEKLHQHGLGQEIIFDEIDSLKSHFNLGKKTWVQLFMGKVFSLTYEKVLDETIAKEILDTFIKPDMEGITKQLK